MHNKVTIIGGGIIGLCCAFYLSREGYQVTVIDKNTIGESCAYGNAGYITPSHFIPLSAPGMISKGLIWMLNPESPFYIKPRWDKDLLSWLWQFSKNCNRRHVNQSKKLLVDISMQSLHLHQELSQVLQQSYEFKQRGLYIVCRSKSYLKKELENLAQANDLGLKAKFVSAEELKVCEPNILFDIQGSVFYPEDAHVHPTKLLTQLHLYLKQQGVVFIENVDIETCEINANRVTELKCKQQTYPIEQLVLACGAWSSKLAKTLDLNIPIQAGKGYSVTIDKSWKTETPFILGEARVAITPFENQIRFGGTMEFSGLDLTIRQRRVNGILNSVKKYIPEFDISRIDTSKAWAGLRPCSPDGLPLIGRPRKYSNLIIATGHAMLGLSLAPVTGRMVADLVQDKSNASPKQFDPDRFG